MRVIPILETPVSLAGDPTAASRLQRLGRAVTRTIAIQSCRRTVFYTPRFWQMHFLGLGRKSAGVFVSGYPLVEDHPAKSIRSFYMHSPAYFYDRRRVCEWKQCQQLCRGNGLAPHSQPCSFAAVYCSALP